MMLIFSLMVMMISLFMMMLFELNCRYDVEYALLLLLLLLMLLAIMTR